MFEIFPDNGLRLVLKHTPDLHQPFSTSYAWYLLIEVEDLTEEELHKMMNDLFESSLIDNGTLAASEEQANTLAAYREKLPEVLSSHYSPHKNDISVAVRFIPAFLEELEDLLKSSFPDLDQVIFGHVGDGNLHLNILKGDKSNHASFYQRCRESDLKVFELVQKYQGSISAEHGVGLLKRDFLSFSRSADEIKLMREIKSIFDPANILNPGKIWR
jgi:FAD/FMN-containing dehydrogenase